MDDVASVRELIEKTEEQTRIWAKKVYIVDGYLVLNIRYKYNIALDRINFPEKLLHWILHLLEKNWCSREMLWRMTHLLCKHFGWEYGSLGVFA